MTKSNINYCNKQILISVTILSLYIFFYVFMSTLLNINVSRLHISTLMVIFYSFIQLLLCLKQKIKPIPINVFNIIESIIFIISILPSLIFIFNQQFILEWEHYIIIILVIYTVIDQFISIKSQPYGILRYSCLTSLAAVVSSL